MGILSRYLSTSESNEDENSSVGFRARPGQLFHILEHKEVVVESVEVYPENRSEIREVGLETLQRMEEARVNNNRFETIVEDGWLESEKVYEPADKRVDEGYSGRCEVEIEARLDADWENIRENYAATSN